MNELNLAQKLVEIRKSIETLKKDGKSYGYTYVKGEQILAKIKDKMDELQVLLIPHVLNQSHSTYDYKVWDKKANAEKDKTDFIVTSEMKYVWLNAEKPSETIEIHWQMLGQQDDISKAYGSGLTYAERYFLLKFFGIPTDSDDPDHENNTSDRYGSNQSTKAASEKQHKLVNRLLDDVAKKLNISREESCETLKKRIKVTKALEEFTSSEASKAIEYLQGVLKAQ